MVNRYLRRRYRCALATSFSFAVASCTPAASDVATGLPPAALLERLSLDLRGVRPSASEREQFATDDGITQARKRWLDDDRLARRVRDWFAPAFRTRADYFPLEARDLGIEEEQAGRLVESIGEETLGVVGEVARSDQPFGDIVTADFTVVDDLTASFLPVTPIGEPDRDGLRRARYTDGRPAAGVLSTSTLYWRHGSTDSNKNRGRANAISRALLCDDHFSRQVSFPPELDLTDPEVSENAVNSNTACLACHVQLEPLASALWGFSTYDTTAADMTRYHPERERDWLRNGGISPALSGTPVAGLAQLGQQIANDPRFVDCTVTRVMEGLLGRGLEADDAVAHRRHRADFIDGGLRLKVLIASVVQGDAYRGRTSATGAPLLARLVSPELFETQLAALTGYVPRTRGGRRLLGADEGGLRVFAGGANAQGESPKETAISLATPLTQQRIAELAAVLVVDSAEPTGFVFGGVDVGIDVDAERLDETAATAALDAMLRSASGDVAPGDVVALLSLWRDAVSDGASPREAWMLVIAAILRDPQNWVY